MVMCQQAWDLLSWAKEMEQEMLSEKTVRDVSGADLLRTRHEEIRAEIEARQDTFDQVISSGNILIENQHYAADEVRQWWGAVRISFFWPLQNFLNERNSTLMKNYPAF